ncbi:MAG TPA: hypothetical protein VM390_06210 [Acidimicrobiales bacterium]|jgi:hypothetical protein|nr:hypothetical protein [Acidimicrobiales bacterium]
MDEWTKVTVRVDENGQLAAVEVDGELDKNNLTEERRSAPDLPDDPAGMRAMWGLG